MHYMKRVHPDIYNENLHKMDAARFILKILYVMNDDFAHFKVLEVFKLYYFFKEKHFYSQVWIRTQI